MGTATITPLNDEVALTSGLLTPGVPTQGPYQEIIQSRLFQRMEEFSNQFLVSQQSVLEAYGRKWVADPLHQWSRQWEYPFTFVHIDKWLSEHGRDDVKVLDAGSGITFFPFLLASTFPEVKVSCCDMDAELEGSFASITGNLDVPIQFTRSALHELPYADASYDIVFSISVLEHTDNYAHIFREFRRILRPGGLVIVTFDVSLDSANKLADENARGVWQTAKEFFRPLGTATLESELQQLKFSSADFNNQVRSEFE